MYVNKTQVKNILNEDIFDWLACIFVYIFI